MAHQFRTTHNPIPPGNVPGPPPFHSHARPQHHYHAHADHSNFGGSSTRNKQVRFDDDFRPSALQIKIKLGPRSHPTSEVKISVYFEVGKLPRIKVKTKRPREQPHRKRRRTYVDEQDGSGRQW